MPVDYHAWTHRPKAMGGTDPIEGTTITTLRATFDGTLAVASLTETIVLFDVWENEDATVFGETLFGGDLQKVSLLRQGLYSVFVQPQWDTAFASRTEALVLDDSSASSASIARGNMSQHAPVSEGGSQFSYPLTFSATRKWPLLGVTEADVLAGVYGRLVVKVLQESGSSKDLERCSLEIHYLGPTASEAPLS